MTSTSRVMELYSIDWYPSDVTPDDADADADADSSLDMSSDDMQKPARCRARYMVRCFCISSDGKHTVLNIRGFNPYFFVRVPDTWSEMHARLFITGLKSKVKGWYSDVLVNWRLLQAKPFYGFTAMDRSSFIRLEFTCMAGFNNYRYLLREPLRIGGLHGGKNYLYALYESDPGLPLLRMFHINELKPCGWFKIRDYHVEPVNTTTCQQEITVDYKNVLPLGQEADARELPRIRYAAFDIEADSSHGDFPIAKKDYQKLARDIITEYIVITDMDKRCDMRPIIATFLKYAFNPCFNANSIEHITFQHAGKLPDAEQVLLGKHPSHIQEAIRSATPRILALLQAGLRKVDRRDTEEVQKGANGDGEGGVEGVEGVEGDGEGAEGDGEGVEGAEGDGEGVEGDGEGDGEGGEGDGEGGEGEGEGGEGGEVDEDDDENIGAYHVVSQVDIMDIVEILETTFPPIDTDVCNYYSRAEQIVQEYRRLLATNNEALASRPADVIQLLLELMCDPYYNSFNINNVYLRERRPDMGLLNNMVPSIHKVCESARLLVAEERRIKRHGKPKGSLEKSVHVQRKQTLDDKVTELTSVLNRFLPPLRDDPIIQIGTTFKRYGESDCYLKHIITLRRSDPIENSRMIDLEYSGVQLPAKELTLEAKRLKIAVPKPLDGPAMAALNAQVIASRRQQQAITDQATVIVESYDSEEEVLLAWQRLIAREDPDFLCGYNIFGFDFKYMFDRATQLGISDSFCQLGRIRGVTQELVEQKLQSAGLGDNLLHYIQMFGRVLVDLLKVMQRMYQLDNYKLDNVCKQFLNKTKVDVSPREIFIRQKGTDRDRMIVAEYCLIDCVLCNRLMDKLELITNNIGMVQVCPVPISYLFLRGQGIKLFSCVAKVCRAEGFVIPTLESNQEAGDGYEGAIVLEPRTGIHYDVVVVADFNSLYPSCMISENLSHEMFIGSCTVKKGDSTDYRGRPLTDSPYERRLLDGEFPGWDYLDIVYDTYRDMPVAPGRKKTVKTVSGHTICRFAQPPDNAKGVIPKILQNLLDSRGRSKKTRDTFPEGSFRWSLYEGLQLAYKVTANSLYGTMGDSNGKIRMKEIAACTTATGRKLINFSANFVRTHYPGSEIVYGDTDSIFIRFDCRDRFGERLNGLDAVYKSLELCTEAAIQISKQLKRPHNLECEKAIFPFILFSKKRYHGHYYTVYGSPAFKPKSMGIVLKRRDNAQIVKHVFGGMLDIIMREQSIPKAIQFVREECQKVLRGEFPLHMFIITKTLRSYYKRPESIPHNVLAQRIAKRDPGNKPRGNDRVAYAYIKVEGQAELGQGERIETPDYITAHDLRLDYGYYITNQIMNPVTQVLELTGKGARLFDELLTDYHLEQDGARRLTSGFSQFIKIHKKPTN